MQSAQNKYPFSSVFHDISGDIFIPSVPALKDKDTGIIKLPNRPPAMLAKDVAEFYGVSVKDLNKARLRNQTKFPSEDYCFQLTKTEVAKWNLGVNSGSYLPWAYTKKGAHMFATILTTPTAIERSLLLVETFVRLEEFTGHAVHPQANIPLPPPVETIEVSASEYWQMRAELAETRLAAGRVRKVFTDAEKQTIRSLKAQGLTSAEIGKRINRNKHSVANFLYRERKRTL